MTTYYERNKERLLPILRQRAKFNYIYNKEKKLSSNADYRLMNQESIKALKLEYKSKRFFYFRATNIQQRGRVITTKDMAFKLFWKWIKQRGKCAYSGKKLTYDSNTHLDHILPTCRGGLNHPDNLQFVCKKINHAKGSLTHEEFVSLCRDVVKHSAKL